MNDIRSKLINMATSLALQESEETGKCYKECTSDALEEACLRLNIDKKEFLKMFIV